MQLCLASNTNYKPCHIPLNLRRLIKKNQYMRSTLTCAIRLPSQIVSLFTMQIRKIELNHKHLKLYVFIHIKPSIKCIHVFIFIVLKTIQDHVEC